MLIQRIKVSNYKTYLDLELSVDKKRPIVLIGGSNGGGKTTLFEAISGVLNLLTTIKGRKLTTYSLFVCGKTGILSPLRYESGKPMTNPWVLIPTFLQQKKLYVVDLQPFCLRKDRDSNPGYP